jgi:hypothetical protein
MIYDLDARLYVEDGAVVEADRASRRSSARAFQAWRAMDDTQRLALVECTLAAANENLNDGYPAAL